MRIETDRINSALNWKPIRERNDMYRILSVGGTDQLVDELLKDQVQMFHPLTAVVMGVAYGGDVESFAKILKGNGEVFGFDTFTGHPASLARSPTQIDALCMNPFYDLNGTSGISVEHQRSELDRQVLDNAHLIKGLINPHSCSRLGDIHLALLDLDIETSMRYGYWAVWPKMVKGGLLVAHDVVPEGHMPWNYKMFMDELISPNEWDVAIRSDPHGLIAWRKK